MRKVIALFALLTSGALAGCEIMVDRYDSASPAFSISHYESPEYAHEIAQEYCAVYGLSAALNRTEVVYGKTYAVYDCRRSA